MITTFNRRDLAAVVSMEQQARIRDALTAAGIDHKVKVIDRGSPSPISTGSLARSGTFGERPSMAYEYIVYVSKQDNDAACQAIK